MNNYYKLLGLQEDASKEQINEAYRKLSQKFHPDKNDNDPFFTLLFQQITEAKQVLTDKEKKSEYDLLLINYSDAYHIYEQQRLEDDFRRQEKKQLFAKKAAKRKKMLLICTLTIISCLSIFLWAHSDSASSGNNSDLKFHGQTLSDSVHSISSNHSGNEKAKQQPVTNDALLPVKQKRTVKEGDIVASKRHVTSNRSKPFTREELANLLSTLNSERSKNNYNTNCITIKKARNSRIDNDLNIATYLQKKGFIIAGREIVSGSFKGIVVGFNGSCLTLNIGE